MDASWRDIWPPDRYEVRITFPPPDYVAVDRYAFAEIAYAAVWGLAESRANDLEIVRIADGKVLFHARSQVSVPFEEW